MHSSKRSERKIFRLSLLRKINVELYHSIAERKQTKPGTLKKKKRAIQPRVTVTFLPSGASRSPFSFSCDNNKNNIKK